MKVSKRDKGIGEDVRRRVKEDYCPKWTVFLFYIKLRRYQLSLTSVLVILSFGRRKVKFQVILIQ